MKTLVRAAIVVSAAAGICIAVGAVASADVGNPASTYQSAMKIALGAQPVPQAPVAAVGPSRPDPVRPAARAPQAEPAATPVPEQFVSEGPARVPHLRPAERHEASVARIVFGAEAKYREIEAFFGRVASAAGNGPGAGAGVPALVLGFLGLAAVVEHHRWQNRWAADENAIELLYARELVPPG